VHRAGGPRRGPVRGIAASTSNANRRSIPFGGFYRTGTKGQRGTTPSDSYPGQWPAHDGCRQIHPRRTFHETKFHIHHRVGGGVHRRSERAAIRLSRQGPDAGEAEERRGGVLLVGGEGNRVRSRQTSARRGAGSAAHHGERHHARARACAVPRAARSSARSSGRCGRGAAAGAVAARRQSRRQNAAAAQQGQQQQPPLRRNSNRPRSARRARRAWKDAGTPSNEELDEDRGIGAGRPGGTSRSRDARARRPPTGRPRPPRSWPRPK
jgi:hypothetical protein